MLKQRPTKISKNAFAFCRYFVALLIVASFIFKIEELVWFVFFVLLLSAILGIGKAPLVFLYSSVERLVLKIMDSLPSLRSPGMTGDKKRSPGVTKRKIEYEIVDMNAMRFAHTLGSLLSGMCVLTLVYNSAFAWYLIFLFMILKIISASGFCPASRLYSCLLSGSCCRLAKRK